MRTYQVLYLILIRVYSCSLCFKNVGNRVDRFYINMGNMLLNVSEELKYWVGIQRGQSYLMGRSLCSLCLVGHTSSECITIKMPYGVHVLHGSALHPIFSYWVG